MVVVVVVGVRGGGNGSRASLVELRVVVPFTLQYFGRFSSVNNLPPPPPVRSLL